MEAFYKQCDEVCLTLVKALEIGFDLESGSLVERCIPSATDLRLTHYPPLPIEKIKSGHTNRIAPHSDYGIVTLLFQDSTGGLEIEDKSNPGAFLAVPPTDKTEMIVNVGDTLQRWTNGKLFGCVHRVTIPESMKNDESGVLPERFSMAYLFKAQRDVSVGPLSKFVTSDNPAKYPDINALQYQSLRNNILFA
jgi:isopenicillin N synthase-like dioxygenase